MPISRMAAATVSQSQITKGAPFMSTSKTKTACTPPHIGSVCTLGPRRIPDAEYKLYDSLRNACHLYFIMQWMRSLSVACHRGDVRCAGFVRRHSRHPNLRIDCQKRPLTTIGTCQVQPLAAPPSWGTCQQTAPVLPFCCCSCCIPLLTVVITAPRSQR